MKGGINIWRALRDVHTLHPAWEHLAGNPITEADLPRSIRAAAITLSGESKPDQVAAAAAPVAAAVPAAPVAAVQPEFKQPVGAALVSLVNTAAAAAATGRPASPDELHRSMQPKTAEIVPEAADEHEEEHFVL